MIDPLGGVVKRLFVFWFSSHLSHGHWSRNVEEVNGHNAGLNVVDGRPWMESSFCAPHMIISGRHIKLWVSWINHAMCTEQHNRQSLMYSGTEFVIVHWMPAGQEWTTVNPLQRPRDTVSQTQREIERQTKWSAKICSERGYLGGDEGCAKLGGWTSEKS